jgi:hypothetical protein
MQNKYAAQGSAHRFVTCRLGEKQSLPASLARPHRVSCRLQHTRPDQASKPNSQFLFSQRQSDTFSFLEPRLLPDAVQSSDTKVVARFTWYSNQSWLRRMLKLAMTAPRAIKIPAVSFQFLDHISYLHFTLCRKTSCVNRNPVHAIRGVQHGFRQGWVGVDRPHQVFDGGFEFHGGNGFGDQLCCLWADDVHS